MFAAAVDLGSAAQVQVSKYLNIRNQTNLLICFLQRPTAAVELGRTAQDWVYLAAALEGYAAAKVLSAAIAHGAFAINQSRQAETGRSVW